MVRTGYRISSIEMGQKKEGGASSDIIGAQLELLVKTGAEGLEAEDPVEKDDGEDREKKEEEGELATHLDSWDHT